MEKKMMKSNGVDSRSSAMKRRRLFSAAAVLLAVCLVFVGAVGATGDAAEHVAKNINSEKTYPSIQEAVEEAKDGETIQVTKSHNLNVDVVKTISSAKVLINVSKNITIDLNGYTVTADYSGVGPYTYITSVIGVANGFKLTMTDRSASKTGTLYVKTTDASKNMVKSLLRNFNSQDNDEGEIDKCSLVIEGGSYQIDFGKIDSSSPGSIVYASSDKSTLVIGGTFKMGNIGAGVDQGHPWIFDASQLDANQIIVTGGTFNTDINHKDLEYEVYVPREYAVHNIGGDTWTVVDAVAYVTEYQKRHEAYDNPGYGGSKYVRYVGYATVEEAVSNVGKYHDSDNTELQQYTITLIKDADVTETLKFGTSESPLAKSTVFDMNGKKITWKGNTDHILTVSGEKLTINSFNIIREGYEYKWNKDGGVFGKLPVNENGQVEVTQSLSIAEPPEPNKYTVAFDANDGDGRMDDQEFTYDVPQSLTLNAFTKTGYTFTGWKTNPNGSESVYTDGQLVKNLTTINNGKVTLYANWTINQYTITFATDGGSTVESITQDYGTDVTAPADPTKDGYTFAGWDKEIPVTMPAENLEITAIWKEIPAEEEIITPPSSGGGGDGGALSFPRFTENGGLVDFGSSKVVKALMLPEGSSGSVLLKVDTVEKWPKAVETEYTFDIFVEKLGDGMAYIHFEIPVSVLESLELTPADICAYHFEGEVWTKLPTTYEVKDGTVCYEAATDSFSPFKLVIEEGAAVPKAEENVPVIPPTETPDVPDEPEILPPIDEPTKPADEPETPAPILAVLAGLGAAVIVRRK